MGNDCDINSAELFEELKSVSTLLLKDIYKTLNILDFTKSNGLQNVLPNICIALRIMLTIPITIDIGERSLSKLKLIKKKLFTLSNKR